MYGDQYAALREILADNIGETVCHKDLVAHVAERVGKDPLDVRGIVSSYSAQYPGDLRSQGRGAYRVSKVTPPPDRTSHPTESSVVKSEWVVAPKRTTCQTCWTIPSTDGTCMC